MNLDFVAEVWDALRLHVDFNERNEAADTLVNLLIDNNFEPDDIKESFRGDKDIAKALKYYHEQHEVEDEYYDEEDYDDEDYDD